MCNKKINSLLCVLFFIGAFSFFSSPLVYADWLSGYSCRAKIPVNATTAGEQSNYQMKVTVHKGSGTNSAGVIYCNNRCQNWPNDIRFTAADGILEKPYWLEFSDATSATFWVQLNTPVSGTTDYYIYYGNAGASSGTSADGTFILSNYQDLMDNLDKMTSYFNVQISGGKLVLKMEWQKTEVGDASAAMRLIAVGDGNNDGANELYGANEDNHIYQYKWNGSSWDKTDLGSGDFDMYNVAIGDGNNDGANEVYGANNDAHIYQFKWNGSGWDKTDVGSSTLGSMSNVAVGDGNNDGVNEVYGASWNNYIYQFKWNGGGWDKTEVGSGGDCMVYVTVGDGNNDGVNEVYGACDDYRIYQYKWNGSGWDKTEVGSTFPGMDAVAIGDGNNDSANEVYGASSDDHIYQFKWNGSSWDKTDLGSAGNQMRDVVVGDGDNDGENEIYGASTDNHAYQFEWNGAGWDKTDIGSGEGRMKGVAVGDGNNDTKNEVYGSGYDSYKIYQFKSNQVFSGDAITINIPVDSSRRFALGVQFSAVQNKPVATEIKYRFRYYTPGPSWLLIPDSDLPNNSVGITSLPIDLSNVTSEYSIVIVDMTLSTTDSSVTPDINEINMNYYERKYISPEPTWAMPGSEEYINFSTLDSFQVELPDFADIGVAFSITVIAKDFEGNNTISVLQTTNLSVDSGTINITSIPKEEFIDDGIWTGEIILNFAGERKVTVTNGIVRGSDIIIMKDPFSKNKLYPNFPNPFRPHKDINTTIQYNLKEDVRSIKIQIYTLSGELVKEWDGETTVGRHRILWDGKNEHKRAVSSGMYIVVISKDGKVMDRRRMVIIK